LTMWHINKAVRDLKHGGVIAYPTEAVYGLGCLPWDAFAVARILALKKRHPDKGLILVASNIEQLEPIANFTSLPTEIIFASWPGTVTWIVPAREWVPAWLTGNHKGIAVRVSAHPVVRKLCSSVGPIVSTSANPSDLKPAKTALRVRTYFGNQINFIVPGQLGNSMKPTEIRDALTGKLIRKSR